MIFPRLRFLAHSLFFFFNLSAFFQKSFSFCTHRKGICSRQIFVVLICKTFRLNMAVNEVAVASSSTVSSVVKRYEVFLSFTGQDVRSTFLSFLYTALSSQEKIETFIDSVNLRIGDNIPDGLFNAIEESKVAIVVFSKNYAFSSWCLRELHRIVQCNKRLQNRILPIFYHVDPSHVRNQEGSYKAAFRHHEKRGKYTTVEITRWKQALRSAANISGRHISQSSRSEADSVAEIVEEVKSRLNCISPISCDDLKHLVGMHNRIREFRPLLCDGSPGERIIGIWGIHGIGKTTLASVVFNRFSSQFERCYFLAYVSDKWKNHGSCTALQEKLFEGLLGRDSIRDGTPGLVSRIAKERLRKTKVLIVLDDVSRSDQFDEILLRSSIRFGDESRIIVTTSDSKVLKEIRVSEKYKVKELNDRQSLELFCLHVFGKSTAPTGYAEESKMVVEKFAKGIPLAIKVFSKSFVPSTIEEWETELKRIETIPDPKIHDKLRSIYNALHPKSRNMFLDIAAFFTDEDRDFVETLLDRGNFTADMGIKELIDKSLITIGRHNKLYMHALVQKLGHEDLGDCCRLWNAEDIRGVLSTDTDTKAIEGIFLDMSMIERKLQLRSSVFSTMSKLRFLKIYESSSVQECKVDLPQRLQSLPESLVYFHWHRYPSESFPSNFPPVELVELSMPFSKVKKLIWNNNQNLGKLKRINLSYSSQLTEVPDLSNAPNVQSINLECCTNLLQVLLPQNLNKLTYLNLMGCTRLQNLSELPRNITCLDLRNCSSLQSIPTNIWELKSLCSLNLSGCSNFNNFPEISSPMECLVDLILDRTAIRNLPRSILKLGALKTLSMNMCESLQFLPRSISCLYSLQHLSLRCCPKLKCLPALPPSLASVDARDCTSLQCVYPSKAVREGWNCNHLNEGKFIFYNCLNLESNMQNNLMADARLRILHIASVTSKYGGDPHMTEICWPGNEIPMWFKHRSSEESSRNVEIPSCRLDDTFLGFVFCVVVDFKDCNLDGDFEMYCESRCTFADGFVATSRRTWIWHWNNYVPNDRDGAVDTSSRAVNSAHVFLFYENGRQILSNLRAGNYTAIPSASSTNYNNVSVTFEFQPRDPNGRVDPLSFPVKSCGVQLVYLRDVKKLGFHSEDDEESISEDGEITAVSGIVEPLVEDHEGENEPHLQENITHSDHQETSNAQSISCCSQLRSQILGLCAPRPTRTIRITGERWNLIIHGSVEIIDENARIENGFPQVVI